MVMGGIGPLSCPARSHGLPEAPAVVVQTRSNSIAIPWPTPTHIEAMA
jgi:hypothetical protein